MIRKPDACTPDPLASSTSWGEWLRRVLVIVLVLCLAAGLYVQGHDLSDAVMQAGMAVLIASTAANAVLRGESISSATFA